ncbi:hypothetical protein ES702_03856 [subsurface metagenome]
MTLTLVRRWFEKLPSYERDLPLLISNGMAYTPRATLDEVERNTELGRKLQSLIEMKTVGTLVGEEQTLAKLRLEELLKRMPDKPLFATLQIPPKTYTPRELSQEVEMNTPVGRQWINAEKKQMSYLVSLR